MELTAIGQNYRTVAIEGCDGTGKTTLANRLVADFGFTVVHSSITPDGLDLATHHRAVLRQPGRLALDRCFISELVYGPLLRGRTRISMADATDLTEAVIRRDGVLIYLTANPVTIRDRLIARDGTAPLIEEIVALVVAYETVFRVLAAYAPVLRLELDAPR